MLFCIAVGVIVFPKLPDGSFLKSDGLWLGLGIIGVVFLWVTVIRKNHKNSMKKQ